MSSDQKRVENDDYAPWFFLRLWRFINHLLTYLLTISPTFTNGWGICPLRTAR